MSFQECSSCSECNHAEFFKLCYVLIAFCIRSFDITGNFLSIACNYYCSGDEPTNEYVLHFFRMSKYPPLEFANLNVMDYAGFQSMHSHMIDKNYWVTTLSRSFREEIINILRIHP